MSGTPGSSARPRVLFLSHSHAFGAFRVGSHHYARALALRGADVVHLSTPISTAHRLLGRVGAEELREVPRGLHTDADGVRHLVPRTRAPRPYGGFRVARELERHGIPATFDVVLMDQPLLWDHSVRALAPRLVYRPTDLYPDGVKATLQTQIIAASDGVVATSEEVLRALGPLVVPTLILPNGVDTAQFSGVGDLGARPAACVYVGALDARFDGAQVDVWARAHPDVPFTVAGPSTGARSNPPNLSYPGAVAYEALPRLLHGARVGLLPLSGHPLNAGRSPMKLYEYLAAGLAVVARETPVLRQDEAAGVFTYTDRDEASTALDRALAHPSPNLVGAARAAAQSWDVKTDRLHAFVRRLPPRAR